MTTTAEWPETGRRPRYTVVVPTHQRRDVVVGSVRRMADLAGPCFEVVVVVDGGTDRTAEALRALRMPFPLRVVEQANAGAARARNAGAALAEGEVVLFLDDDMRVTPGLLRAHDEAYGQGADAVIGHIPLDPAAPATFLTPGICGWADARRDRLVAAGGELALGDLLTGQLSVRRDLFARLGGFDEDFTRGGSFGGEDTDFGHRLLASGAALRFAPDAVSYQHYVVTPRQYLRQWGQAGAADALGMRKHPDQVPGLLAAHHATSRWNRLVSRPVGRVPLLSPAVGAAARAAALAVVGRSGGPRATRLFFTVRDLEYWRGLERAGGVPGPRRLRVLCYHALTDLAGARRVEQYGVPPDRFRGQLRLLRAAGFVPVCLDEVLRALDGDGGLPRRPVLVTFDDCFADLREHGLPALRAAGVPAAAFAVAGQVGGTNAWDVALGAPELPLLDADGLRALSAGGVEVGAHGGTHRPLHRVADAELPAETAGAVAALAAVGVPRPRAFAYPHGEHDGRVRRAVADAGLRAAFTVRPGTVHPDRVRTGAQDRYALPRIEVLRRDGAGVRFLATVVLGRRLDLPPAVPRTARRAASAARRRLVRR